MLNEIIKTIKTHDLIEKGDSILVGVSGGPDSMCLLHVLYCLKDVYNLKIAALNLDHQFRGIESQKDSAYVKEFCDNLGIKSYMYSENIEDYGRSINKSFEEAARIRRYELYFETMKIFGANKIAVAHNRNDQVETILMRIMRGTGIDGMLGIPYKRSDGVIRPILDIDRVKIEQYCEENNLKPRIDKTNFENIYTRNKIRLELIPYIEENFNSSFKSTLLRNTITIRDDVDYLEQKALEAINKIIINRDSRCLVADISKFKEEHISIQRRVLRALVNITNGERYDLTFKQVESLINMINKSHTGKQRTLPNGLVFKINYGEFEIFDIKDNSIKTNWKYKLEISREIIVEESNVRILINEISKEEVKSTLNKTNNRLYILDFDKVEGSIFVRNRNDGDRFSPLGLKGTKKLKDYFIDLKVNREKRDQVPIVCDEVRIMCVLGYQVDERYKVTRETKRFLKIEYKDE